MQQARSAIDGHHLSMTIFKKSLIKKIFGQLDIILVGLAIMLRRLNAFVKARSSTLCTLIDIAFSSSILK